MLWTDILARNLLFTLLLSFSLFTFIFQKLSKLSSENYNLSTLFVQWYLKIQGNPDELLICVVSEKYVRSLQSRISPPSDDQGGASDRLL